ncbi:NAD-dependent epimerase/dehydratase family protein [Agromyces luteolus]|uniref:NAD(P)H-binding protein n=1 Tax=Agromyces luteolus TaxID=88373 RepID=A0A7C9M023_9MICO|nr:NAD-dependent epimerase/dehydratase family protein [Agromyces luteolus]MUN08637.1 NAD(P)H-binding protein [Agromyces luteolus]
MGVHLVVGAGASGIATADLLAQRGESVRMVTRRGARANHPAVEAVAADAADIQTLARLSRDADVIYNCANPPYNRWLTDWPPLHASLLSAAERADAVLVSAATLYGYAPGREPMTEQTPLVGADAPAKLRLRADMWRDALEAHQSGRVRVSEVRSSDILQGTGIFSLAVAKQILAHRPAIVPVPLDQPHTFTSASDVARALVTVASEPDAWGQAWHVPSPEPLSLRQVATRFSTIAHEPLPRLLSIPYPLLWTAGLVVPLMRELRATRYQWDRPFIMDSTHFTDVFAISATSWDDALRESERLLRVA